MWRAGVAAAGWRTVDDGPVAAAIVSFLDERGDAAERTATLRTVLDRLPEDGRLVAVDHNQPRRAMARLGAVPALWRHGLPASRARYPTAREIASHGFVVERLRLVARERAQIVVARPREAVTVRTT